MMTRKHNTPKVGFIKNFMVKLHVVLCLAVFVMGCSNPSVGDNSEPLTLCYNEKFAQRFSLPTQKAMVLSKGLYAIGFRQTKQTGMRLYLYIDSSLDIHSPKECGDFCDGSEFYSFLNINDKDKDFLYAHRSTKIDNRMVLISKSGEGYISSAQPECIKKDILPGISLISIRGFLYPVFESKYSPLEILVQKRNTGDSIFVDNEGLDYNRVYRFDIPDKLVKHIRENLNEDWIVSEKKPMHVYYP